ncbi:unnamed protein product [Cylindrotheca closterium]|uniref:Uncharacterized protein n=1 Tax=Cylindrotheca closterium TaxID=2856 RepID=A0AAD2CR37_9STRA|nr:unnamed protein product [Cylindrotheca closterium]
MKSCFLLPSLLLLLLGLNNSHGLLCGRFSARSLISLQPKLGSSRRIELFLKAENEDEETSESDTKQETKRSEPITLFELAEMEARASKRINDRLLLPYRLGEALTNVAWFVVILSVFLNAFGYAYIRGDYGIITIGTIEERNFQIEMRKSSKEAMESSVDAATRNQNLVDAASFVDQQ